METLTSTKTYTLQIPQSDVRLLSQLAKKMGWIKKELPKQKTIKQCGLDTALEDVEKGNLKSFNCIDALMDYLHS